MAWRYALDVNNYLDRIFENNWIEVGSFVACKPDLFIYLVFISFSRMLFTARRTHKFNKESRCENLHYCACDERNNQNLWKFSPIYVSCLYLGQRAQFRKPTLMRLGHTFYSFLCKKRFTLLSTLVPYCVFITCIIMVPNDVF